MIQRTTLLATMSMIMVLASGTSSASAQETPPAAAEEKPPAAEPDTKPAADPPSLDDLLEIDPGPNAETGDADADVAESVAWKPAPSRMRSTQASGRSPHGTAAGIFSVRPE